MALTPWITRTYFEPSIFNRDTWILSNNDSSSKDLFLFSAIRLVENKFKLAFMRR